MDTHRGIGITMTAVLFLLVGSGGLLAATPAFAQGWPPPPRTVPSIGPRTPDPTTAFPSPVPSIGPRTPDPTTAFPNPVPSIGPRTPDPTTAFPNPVPSIGPRTPDPTTAPSIGTSR